ncbi:hypothetical protein [Adhaeribacter radiodurans]|uniref:Uncharacterized protein n=1 Tax=Adhaeribacter radiodurans TaxID=2745197 RepID=A0A7L7LA77_9BACT|nr:hypothetical protein [Adhaeribacter radiodurans]QMU29309.1 hypothetical protein HUW48_15265 [Adhaeribacter radiodurans]
MKILNSLKAPICIFFFILPLVLGCSVFRGKAYNDPRVAAQAEIVDLRKIELKEAKQREKAARQRLKAAKNEFKALKSRAKRGY